MISNLSGPSLMFYLCSNKNWNKDFISKLPL